MKETELRIGNIVEIIHIDYGRKINAINVYDLVSIHEESESLSFHPIPLTEEWVKKFGFESDFDRILPYQIGYKKNEIVLDSNFILTVEGQVSDLHSLGKELKFVHELQNLYFALTGEELTLQNINSENANE